MAPNIEKWAMTKVEYIQSNFDPKLCKKRLKYRYIHIFLHILFRKTFLHILQQFELSDLTSFFAIYFPIVPRNSDKITHGICTLRLKLMHFVCIICLNSEAW